MAEDKKSFAESIMDSMLGRSNRPDDDITRIASVAGAQLDRMIFAARSTQNMYIDVTLKPVNVNQSFEVNIDNISKNFTALDNKVRVVDQSVRVASVLLDSNRKLMQATSASIAKAISDSKRADSRNAFSEIENKMEESRVIGIVDQRINEWLDAGYFDGNGGIGGFGAGVIGGAAGGVLARMSAARMIAAAGSITLRSLPTLAAVVAIPQAIENPDANLFTELGHMMDDLKTFIDPTYKGHQAEDLVKIFTNYASKETKRIWAEEKEKKERAKAEEQHVVEQMQSIVEEVEASRKAAQEIHTQILKQYGIMPGWVQKARNDRYGVTDGSDMNDGIKIPEMPKRSDYYDPISPANSDILYRKALDAWKRKYGKPEGGDSILKIPDELRPEPKEELKTLEIPDSMRIKKTSSITELGRVRVASLGDTSEFLSNPDDVYYDNINRLMNSSEEEIVESFQKKFDEYSITSSSFAVSARMMDFYSFSTMNFESMSDLSIVSKRKLTIEAPEIVLRGALRYEGIRNEGNGGGGNLGLGPTPSMPGPTNAEMFPYGGYQPSQEFYPRSGSGSGYSGGSSGSGGGGGPVSDRVSYAMNYFMSQGWTQAQAAGIVGNLMQESYTHLDHTASNGSHMGLAQWDSTRRAKFEQVYGKPFSSSTFDEQLQFINWELRNTHKAAGDRLSATNDPRQAALVVEELYEVSGGSALGKRQDYADTAMGAVGAPSSSDDDITNYVGTAQMPTNRNILDPKEVPRSGGSKNSRAFGGNRGSGKLHTGMDVPINPGDPIHASMDGKIVRMDNSDARGYGYVVDVQYADGTVHRYAHLGTNAGGRDGAFGKGLKVGSTVKQGDVIGYGGYSGNAGPEFPHFHYEVIKGDYYNATGGRPAGRETDFDHLNAGRLDPAEYWKSKQEAAAAAAEAKKPVNQPDTGDKLMEFSKQQPTVVAPVVKNNVQITEDQKKAIRNTHDGVNMSASKTLSESVIV